MILLESHHTYLRIKDTGNSILNKPGFTLGITPTFPNSNTFLCCLLEGLGHSTHTITVLSPPHCWNLGQRSSNWRDWGFGNRRWTLTCISPPLLTDNSFSFFSRVCKMQVAVKRIVNSILFLLSISLLPKIISIWGGVLVEKFEEK